jgi:hypothetical protein
MIEHCEGDCVAAISAAFLLDGHNIMVRDRRKPGNHIG